jgi:small-conductance mechanosensitive channel
MAIMELISTVKDNHYLYAVSIFILSFLGMMLVLLLSEHVFLRIARKTKTKVDDLIVERTRYPSAFLIMVIGARVAAESLQSGSLINWTIEKILSSIIIITIAHIIIIIFDILIDQWGRKIASRTKSNIDDDLLTLFHRMSKIILYLLGILYVLTIWGIEIAPLLASLGVAGIAVAFALQSTLGNIFGGVSLIVDKAFRIGDVVELGDGTLGTVDKVTLRSTRIKTWDNELVTIPNGKLADSRITNWHMPNRQVRISVTFGVEYGSDPEKVKKVVMGIIKKHKKTLKEPAPYILFKEMGEFSLDFIARFWIEDISDKIFVKDEITTQIYKELRRHKIGIPFPTRTIYTKKG